MSSLSLTLVPPVLILFLSRAAAHSLTRNFYTTHVSAGLGAHSEGQRLSPTPASAGLGAHQRVSAQSRFLTEGHLSDFLFFWLLW